MKWKLTGYGLTGKRLLPARWFISLMKEMNIKLNFDIAVNLYTAIATDTGGFRYSNTRLKTHLIAADLLAL